MSKEFQQRLRALRVTERQITPDPAWVRATRETLLNQIRNTLPETPKRTLFGWGEILRVLGVIKFGHAIRKPIMAVSSFLLLALGGSILSVSAAERSLPGDFFYGLKLVTEQARLALTSTKEEKLKLKTEFTERRVTELQQIVKDDTHRERVPQVTEILKRDLGTLKQQLGEVTHEGTPQKAVAAAKLVDQKTNQVISALQVAKDQLPAGTKEKVTEVQSAAADTGIKAIEVLAEKHQESSENVPAAEVAQALQDHAKTVADVTVPFVLTHATGTTSTIAMLPDAVVSSTAITSSTLPVLVSQVKDLTTQAFAVQKAKEQLEAAASVLSQVATTSTAAGTSGETTSTGDGATASSTGGATSSNVMPSSSVSSSQKDASTGTAR